MKWQPKRFRLLLSVLLVSLLGMGIAACGGATRSSLFPGFMPRPSTIRSAPYIKHVVIIVQENRSFDNMFNGFPGADTAQIGQRHDGTSVALSVTPFESGGIDIGHFHGSFRAAYAGGNMNGFDEEGTFGITSHGYLPVVGPPDYA